MLKFLKWFFGLFSPYVNSFERKVDRFFKHIKSTDTISSVKERLMNLMRENLIVVNVWLEKKFKGYTYLDKKTRRKMYEDVRHIVADFEAYRNENKYSTEVLRRHLDEIGLTFPNGFEEQLQYLAQIMSFLQPGKHYHYIKTASFGKLLRDPGVEKLEGDCNQIVTLYIYLFSLHFPLELLQIKLLPEHVCLHFKGVDVECTAGQFQKYVKFDHILPVTEIISTNLLDLADFREEVQSISPQIIVKSSQLAYAISSLKPLVAKNLNVAYHNLAVSAMKAHDYETAIFYLGKTDDREALLSVYRNAAIYYLKQNSFKKAAHYAHRSGDGELERSVKHNEGIYYYNNGNISRALEIFSYLGDDHMKRACYQKQYNELVKKVAGVRQVADHRRYKAVYQKMLDLAQKIGDSILEDSVKDILKRI